MSKIARLAITLLLTLPGLFWLTDIATAADNGPTGGPTTGQYTATDDSHWG